MNCLGSKIPSHVSLVWPNQTIFNYQWFKLVSRLIISALLSVPLVAQWCCWKTIRKQTLCWKISISNQILISSGLEMWLWKVHLKEPLHTPRPVELQNYAKAESWEHTQRTSKRIWGISRKQRQGSFFRYVARSQFGWPDCGIKLLIFQGNLSSPRNIPRIKKVQVRSISASIYTRHDMQQWVYDSSCLPLPFFWSVTKWPDEIWKEKTRDSGWGAGIVGEGTLALLDCYACKRGCGVARRRRAGTASVTLISPKCHDE